MSNDPENNPARNGAPGVLVPCTVRAPRRAPLALSRDFRRLAFLFAFGALVSLPAHAQTVPSASVAGEGPVLEGTDATFTVTLSSPAPQGGVTVNVSVGESQWSDIAEPMDTGRRTVTFYRGESEKTIRVRTVGDDSHEPNGWLQFIVRSGAGYRPGSQYVVRVVMLDDDGPAVTVTPRDLVVAEADDPATSAKENEASYTVVLGRRPTGTVTVTPSIHTDQAGNARVDTTPLRFTAANWHMPQSVTVTGVNDNLVNERARGAQVDHAVAGFGDVNRGPSVRVTVTDDDGNAAPSFASDASIADQIYSLGLDIELLKFPRARSGDVVTYALRPSPPAGLTFEANRASTAGPDPGALTGTPTALQGKTTYTYTATDRKNRTASLTFSITVVAEDLMPSFRPGTSIANRSFTKDVQIEPLVLPAATGGNGTLHYSVLGPPGNLFLPDGLSFDEETRTLSGTPTALQGPTTYAYRVADADSDRATLTFTIEVEEALAAVPNLTVAAVDGATDRLRATWDTVDGATRYAVRSVKVSNSTLSGSDDITSTSHIFTGLEANTEYDITVTALGPGNPAPRLARSTRRARTNSPPGSSSRPTVTDLAPSFAADASIPDRTWTQDRTMADLLLPAASGGDGTLTYDLLGTLPAGLSFDPLTRRLTGTPTTTQAATTYTYRATDEDGDAAELAFAIIVAEDPRRARVQAAVEQALAAVARRATAGALDNIGARFGDIGASGLSLAGEWLPLEGGAATATAENNGLRPCAAERFGGGYGGLPGCAAAGSRTMEAGRLFGASAFSLHLGASEGSGSSPTTPLWAVWGRGDLGTFAGRGEAGLSYDGALRTGWLGIDARAGPWVAGLAVSHGEGEADYAFAGDDPSGRGRLETSLTAAYPYGRWTLGDGLELRGVVGAGEGEARHKPEDGATETGGLTMRMASLGARRALPDLAGVALAVRADASITRVEIEEGPDAIHGLSADSWRLRAGMEASRRFALEGDAAFEPFLEAAMRQDGGDGLEGSGVELAGGLRWVAPEIAVELRGRWLTAHSEEGAEEKGVSLTARAGPGADGRGLFFALSPRWGADAGGARALWSDEMPNPSASGNSGAVDARLGYGFGLAAAGVLTPFAEAGLAGGDSGRLKIGTRFDASRADLRLELAGERRERAAATPEHALRLDLLLRF